MPYRVMIVVEDIEYLSEYNDDAEPRESHGADAGWYGWTGMSGDVYPTILVDYEDALALAEMLTVVSWPQQSAAEEGNQLLEWAQQANEAEASFFCPHCKTGTDEHGYCVDVGCRYVGKAVIGND